MFKALADQKWGSTVFFKHGGKLKQDHTNKKGDHSELDTSCGKLAGKGSSFAD